jgi:hypothetical protein
MSLASAAVRTLPKQVAIAPHRFGNNVWQCSKAMLIVACASVLVNGGVATEGGIPRSPSSVDCLSGETKGRQKAGWWGSKGTF